MPRPLAATAFAALALCAAPSARPLAAQAPAAPPAPFTVDDALDLATWTVADLSDGGRWLVSEGIADPGKLAIIGWSYGG